MDWFQSFISWTKEKINSPLYVTFFVAVVLWNWKSFYVLFWLDSENFSGISQLQYSLMVSRNIGYTTIYQLDWVINHLWFFGVPTLITFIAIWYLPQIHNIAHKRYLEFRFDRELEFDRQNSLYQEKRQKEVQKQLVTVKEIEEDTKEIRKIEQALPVLTTEDRWRVEYTNQPQKMSAVLAKLPNFVYKKSGFIVDSHGTNIQFSDLALLDSNGLTSFEGQNKVVLTEKGKFFLKLFLEESI
jgi:hypothetical protein